MQVTLYTTTTCPYCYQLKDYLKEKKIDFTEKLIDQDDAALKEMQSLSGGFQGVPFVVIENQGQKQTVIGFNKKELNKALNLGE